MDRKPRRPEEQEQQRSDSAHGEGSGAPDAGVQPASGEVERLGPLSIRRMRKDDGRALIVYSREPPSP
jgi:hypothetical protein